MAGESLAADAAAAMTSRAARHQRAAPHNREGTKMFEVGEFYHVEMWEPDGNGGKINVYPGCKVLEVNLPLVKFRDRAGTEVIVNTVSQVFVKARKGET
jgi:hypothetical protein